MILMCLVCRESSRVKMCELGSVSEYGHMVFGS